MTLAEELTLVLLAAPFLLAAAFLRAPEALDRFDPLPAISGSYPSIVYVPVPELRK